MLRQALWTASGSSTRAWRVPAPRAGAEIRIVREQCWNTALSTDNGAYLVDMGTTHAHWLVVALALICNFTSGTTHTAASGPKWRPPVAQFNNFGLVSPFVELLKTFDKRDAAKVRHGVEATPSTEWSQSDDEVVLTIWVPQLDKSTARVLLSITTLSFTGTSATGQRYELELEKLGGDAIADTDAAWRALVDRLAPWWQPRST